MKKAVQLLLLVAAVTCSAHAQQRLFDQRVQLKTCNITIDANAFIATTFIEMEFYNPKNEEVEGLHTFELNRGQVVTAFQLDLNGKYRDGSIEERWKANRAYSSIVGKRIDPAILQMDWQNHYSLRIYPIPAKSSRKVTLTITQMMDEDSNRLTYFLPLHFQDTCGTVNIKINCSKYDNVNNVIANKGLLEGQHFTESATASSLNWSSGNCLLNKPVSFSLLLANRKPMYCITNTNNENHFVMRVFPDVPKTYQIRPQSLHIYWDVSFSGKDRNLTKEVDFLENYLRSSAVKKVYITPFNQEVKQQRVFSFPENSFYSIREYLLNCSYEGATMLGSLDFSRTSGDMILLFSDGINSYGRQLPHQGHVPVNCITSSSAVDYTNLLKIATQGAGTVVNLLNTTTEDAIKKISLAENFLSKIKGEALHFNEQFPVKIEKNILLTGTGTDDFTLVYGNSGITNKTENYLMSLPGNCSEEVYTKLRMLKAYDSLVYSPARYWQWQDMIVFGLTEKVVTPQTSYLVLERIEDYIKYNIAPPAELVEKCAELNYVYNSGYKINVLKRSTQQDALRDVSKEYNKRIQWWDKTASLIQPDILTVGTIPTATAGAPQGSTAQTSSVQNWNDNSNSGSAELKEVVVTSAYGVRRTARMVTSSVQVVQAEQLTVVRQQNLNEALAGKVAGLQVRSQSNVKLGYTSMIRLRGENGLTAGPGAVYVVNGTIMDNSSDINVDDIEDVTVLQGPAAAALFGPDGANGAIVINTKKARRGYSYPQQVWTAYKLSDMEDVDYLLEIKNNDISDAWAVYERLQKGHADELSFYFDMADYFFEISQPGRAQKILFTAIELCKGSSAGLRLAAFTLEKWKKFDTAIELYRQILATEENNIPVKRDLALAYLQNKKYQLAVNTYYGIITAADYENQYLHVKENALAELNAVIALEIEGLDISFIDTGMIKILPACLRIAVEGNNNSVNNVQILEPGNVICNFTNPATVAGGRLKTDAQYWNNSHISEYVIKNAVQGKYRVKVNANGYYNYYGNHVPEAIRIVSFKNFHKKDMTIEVQHVSIDNQYGVVEIGEVLF